MAPAPPAILRLTFYVYLVGSEEQHASVQRALELARAERVPEAALTWLVVNVAAPGGVGPSYQDRDDRRAVTSNPYRRLTGAAR